MTGAGRISAFIYRHSPVMLQNILCSLEGKHLERLRYGREFERWARFYADSRNWSEAELLEYQREQVGLLLRECYEYVPFYAERWRSAGVSPSDFSDLSDLAKYPFTTKEDLFRHGDRLISRGVRKSTLVAHATSGSTGLPLVRYLTREEVQRHYAIFWDRMRPGVRRGDRYAAFQGYQIVPPEQKDPPFWRENRACNQRLYSILHLRRSNLHHYAKSLAEEPFVYYQGYANFLAIVAEFMSTEGLRLRTPPRAVFSTSEELSVGMRRLMEKVWQTRVWNEYCQAERCALIMECEHGNCHAQMEYGVIEYEFVGREGGFRLAEIVCTGLVPHASPLVRYRIGDRVLIEDGVRCPCGRPGPVIKAVCGRVSDYIVGGDGRIHPDVALIAVKLRNVSRMQVVQETPGEVVVRIVPSACFSAADSKHLRRCFEEWLGKETMVRVELVHDLERQPNGKVFSIINRIGEHRLHRSA